MTVHVDVAFCGQAQLSAGRDNALGIEGLVISQIDGMQGIPQAHKFLLDSAIGVLVLATVLPQVGIGTGVEKRGEQARSEHLLDSILHLGRQVVAAQAVQAIQVAVDFSRIGHRAVDVVEVADDELCPIDELVELLGLVAHRLAVGIIEGKHHFDVGGDCGVGQFHDQVVDGRHSRQQMRPGIGIGEFLFQVMGKELPAAAVGKDKAIVLKALRLKVISCHLLEKRKHYLVVSF